MKKNFYNQFSARAVRGFVLGFMLLMGLSAFGQTVFTDDFNRASLTTSAPTTYTKTMTSGTAIDIVSSTYLAITPPVTSGAGTAGISYVTAPLSSHISPFNGQLDQNTGTITWTFNMRRPGSNTETLTTAFTTSAKSGVATVLAASSSTLTGGSVKGYAVALVGTGTASQNAIHLCSFTDGIGNTAPTAILSSGAYTNGNYFSIKVTYTVSGNMWTLDVRSDGTGSFADPTATTSNSYASFGPTANMTNTSATMNSFGFLYNHSTNSNVVRIDNYKVVATAPATPSISVPNPTSLTGFFYSGGAGPSTQKTFTVDASNLTGNLVITPPTNYEITTTSGDYTTGSSPISFTPSSGTVTTKTIYVRLKAGLADNAYDETINITSTGATARTVTCNGDVSSTATVIVSTASLSAFPNTAVGSNSTSSNFTVSGSNLGANNITITPPTNFELSTDNSSFSTSAITLTPTGGSVSSTPIYARYSPTGSGAYTGNIAVSSTAPGVSTENVAVSGYLSKFYYKGSGLLSLESNWSGKSDFTGDNVPISNNFTTAGVSYVITTSKTTEAAWSVSGSGSKIIVGDPSVAGVELTIANGFGITGTIDIPAALSGSNSVILKHTTAPTFGTLDVNSEVHFQANLTITGSTTFGKVFIDSGDPTQVVNLSGTPHTIKTSLTVAANSVMQGSGTTANYNIVSGAAVTINGTLRTSRIPGLVNSGISPGTSYGVFQFSGADNLTLGSTSTIQYEKGNSASVQTITPRADYANLTITDGTTGPAANNKTLAGATTVSGVLTINLAYGSTINSIANITLGNSASIVITSGSLDAAPTFGTSVNLTYNGTTAKTMGFEMPTSSSVLNNLTINNAAGVTLGGNVTANGTLTLTNGKVTLGANNLTAAALSDGSSTAYVVTNSTGTLIQSVANAASPTVTFPIGTSSTYRPATVTYTANTTAAGTLAGRFITGAPGSTGLPITTQGVSITGVSPTGYWSVAESPTLGGTYTMNVDATGFTKSDNSTTITLLTDIRLIKRPTGGSWVASGSTTTTGPGSLSSVSAAGFSGFSDFGIGGADIVLPVELTNFQAKTYQKSTLLTWTTASEKDNALFNIEQSTNGTDFQTVGQVKGRGTTSAATTYNYEHTTPSVGINYYRLQQVDLGGTATYSAVRSVLFGKTGLVVKTTLVRDALDIITSDDIATTLSIFNLSGQAVFTGKVQGAQRLNVSTLPAGLYIVRTATGDVARFVKQ